MTPPALFWPSATKEVPVSGLKPCKFLDYSDSYAGQCTLVTAAPHFPDVKYWHRDVVPYDEAPRNVQFCGQGRGRINSIFACYNGGMHCYAPVLGDHPEGF